MSEAASISQQRPPALVDKNTISTREPGRVGKVGLNSRVSHATGEEEGGLWLTFNLLLGIKSDPELKDTPHKASCSSGHTLLENSVMNREQCCSL